MLRQRIGAAPKRQQSDLDSLSEEQVCHEPHPEIKALFTFTALNLCRLVPAQISINRESTLAGKSTSAQGASKK